MNGFTGRHRLGAHDEIDRLVLPDLERQPGGRRGQHAGRPRRLDPHSP
jgi:hypothetical protein